MLFFKKKRIEKLKAKEELSELFAMVYQERDPLIYNCAAQAFGQLTSEKAIAFLKGALEHQNDAIRLAVVRILAQSRHDSTVPFLVQALNYNHIAIRKTVARALGHFADSRAIEPLLKLLKDTRPDVYACTLEALESIGATLSLEERRTRLFVPLTSLVAGLRVVQRDTGKETLEWMGWERDANEDTHTLHERKAYKAQLRTAVINAVLRMGWEPDESALAAEYWVMQGDWNRCVALGAPAVDVLISCMKEGDENTRKQCYNALVQLGPLAADKLIQAMQDEIADMRLAAFRALAKLGIKALPQIIETLKDEHSDVRLAAVRELGTLAHPDVIEPLIGMFADGDPAIRRAAYQALLHIGAPAQAALIHALRYNTRSDVRWGCAYALEALGWKPTKDEYGAAYCIVKGRWDWCVHIGLAAIPPLLEFVSHWDSAIQVNAIQTLVQIDSERAPDVLVATIKTLSSDKRMGLVSLLASLDDKVLSLDMVERMFQALLAVEEDDGMLQHLFTLVQNIREEQKKQAQRRYIRQETSAGQPYVHHFQTALIHDSLPQ